MFRSKTNFNLVNLEAAEEKEKQSQDEKLNNQWTLALPDAKHAIGPNEITLPNTNINSMHIPVGKRLDAFFFK